MNRIRAQVMLLLLAATAAPWARADDARAANAVPVVFDTDIGDDIDDTWALGFLLRCPELDVKLAVGDYGRPVYRAKLLAKFLQAAGRADVPVGLGLELARPKGEGQQAAWVKDYDLAKYPGQVLTNGVQAIIDTIMQSPVPVTVLAIGPLPNIAEALKREPRIAERARFVGMHGSVRVGYNGGKTPAAEWNVKVDPASCRQAFTAPWDMTITPLDTCGIVTLDGELYARVRDSKDPIAAAILENYRVWDMPGKPGYKAPDIRSTVLYDTVAVYLAWARELCTMERVPLRVTDDGYTRLEEGAKPVNAATAWKDLDGFKKLLVDRLTNTSK